MINLLDKIVRLQQTDNLAMFKWSTLSSKIEGKFVALSDLRLELLMCYKGQVHYSSAAGLLVGSDAGFPSIIFKDTNVNRVLSGERSGINIIGTRLREGETCAAARGCEALKLSDNVSLVVKGIVMYLANTPAIPVSRIVMPELLRLSRKPEVLKPVYSKELLETIGAHDSDNSKQLHDKFMDCLPAIGTMTESGVAVPFDLIYSGGMVVAAGNMITKTGGVVFSMPCSMLAAQIKAMQWDIQVPNVEQEAFNGTILA